MARRRRAFRGLRPRLDALETRQLLSSSAVNGPTMPMETLNLQLSSAAGATLAHLMPLITAAGATVQATTISGLYEVQGPSADMGTLAQQLAASSTVQYAEPVQTLHVATVPNDPDFTNGSQWGLNGTWGINAPAAWNTTTGSDKVIVADVDTGMDYNNPDLIDNTWLNQAEIPSSVLPKLTDVYNNGVITFTDLNNPVNQGPGKIVDTNGDGVITGSDVIAPTSAGGWASGSTQDGNTSEPDDLIGWNFANNNNNPMDQNGHGTVTAGEIGAVGNNGIGISGVDWNVQIMPVQAFDASGNGTDVQAAEAIEYAVQNGAKVINCSFTGINTDPVFTQAIDYADSEGVIIVAAAGNNALDLDNPLIGFAAYPNVLTVASIDSDGDLSSWSNYGAATVQLAAPGSNILSTLFGGDGYMSGTSMAAPFVTGTVALVEAAHPTWSMSQVIGAVVDHTTSDPALAGFVTSGGVLNAAAAVANTDGAYVTSANPNGAGTSASPLSSFQLTFNEQINPATFTPSQVTLSGPAGTISGVSVTAVAGSNDHQFLISFASQTAGGTYTLKVGPSIQDWYGNSMDQNRNGVNGEASDAFVYVVQPIVATLVRRDTTSQGNWIGAYGSQGYNIIGSTASYPSYATVSVAGETATTWAATTNDPRALQTPGGANRIAACWYSGTSFTVSINLTDGQAHDVAVYAVDWPDYGRSEQIQVSSASTGAVLDTETISNFNGGLYLQWRITGDVIIQFSGMGGTNAVLSGLFFDPPTQPFDVLSISSPSTTDTAGTAQTFTVTALGPNGQTDTHYTGTIHFSSTDPHAVLPANYTFTTADAGVHTFSATLETAGIQSVTATDTASQSTTGSESNISVSAAAASSLTVTGFPNPDTAGAAGNFTVTAYDPYGNIATGYTGTVHFTSSDPQASLPASYTFTAADTGKHTFSATLKTAGTQSVTATDTASQSTTGSESNISVSAAAASSLTVTGFPNSDTAGAAGNFTVTAYDPYGNIATGYAGTVHFTSSDPQASLPASYTFTAADTGKHTFSATLKTAGTQSVTATDTASQSTTGSESNISVSAAAASSLTVTGFPNSDTAGAAGNFTVTAYDPYGNIATGYAGTVHFTSSDPQASLPASYTFTAADTGKHTFSATLKTAGTQSVTATDTSSQSTTGSEPSISVIAAAASSLTVSGFPNPDTAGATSSFTVTAYDSYGNLATGYAGTVHFTSTDPQASLPANYTFTAADAGKHTFSATLKTAGTQSITATDTASASITGSTSVTVASSANASAALVKRDTTTEGNWIGVYGSHGYDIFGGGVNCPSYATVSETGASATTWAATTNDPRALQTPSGAGRIAVCWYSSTSFSVNINLTDGQAHDIAVYALDWPDYGRSEQIQVSSASTGAVLDTETISNFNDGLYLQWQITGNVIIKFSGMGGTNAVLSGLFFDPPTQPFDVLNISSPSATDTAGTAQTFTVTALGPNGQTDTHYTGTIHFSSTDPHAVLPANYTFTAADAGVHTFSATLETAGTQSVTATDTSSQSTTGSESNISVIAAAASSLTVTGFPNPDTAGAAGSFTVTAYDPYGNIATGYAGTVYFTSSDPQASLPAGYSFTAADAGKHTFSATLKTAGTQSVTATDTASQSTTGTEPNITVIAAAASSLTVTGLPNPDTAGAARNFTVTAYDPCGNIATGYTGTVHFTSTDPQAVLPANYTFTAADAGVHTFSATLETAGTQSVTATDTASASVTGTTSVTVASSANASAALVKRDSTTEGNWIGAYGSQGYNIIGNAANYPSYATVSVAGETATTWAATTNDPRALQTPGGASRIAACWYSGTSFTVNINLTDGQAHDIAVYALDWPDYGRSEQIQVSSASTRAVLDTETISNFNGGLYLQWQITGNVIIRFSGMGGTNAVLSGLFFDGLSTPPPATATLVKRDATTEGNWIGVYGSQGYNIFGGGVNCPSYATVSATGASATTWAATTNDPRRLRHQAAQAASPYAGTPVRASR